MGEYIQEPKLLHEKVTDLHKKYVPNGVKRQELGQDIQKEYQRQKEYLEKSVESLKRKLQKDSEVHRQDNMRVMQENVSLIREINDLRKEINFLKHERQQQRLHVSKQKKQSAPLASDNSQVERSKEYAKEMELNKQEINALKRRIEDQQRQRDAPIQMLASQDAPGDDMDSSPQPQETLAHPADSVDDAGAPPEGDGGEDIGSP